MNFEKFLIINFNVFDKELIECLKIFKIWWKVILKWCKVFVNLVGKLVIGFIFGLFKNGLIMINGKKINFFVGLKWGKYFIIFKFFKNILGEKFKRCILFDWDV